MIVRSRSGKEIPLGLAAEFESGRAYSRIYRVDGRRTINVTAGVDRKKANANEILNTLQPGHLATLTAQTPGLTYSLEGDRKERDESMAALGQNFLLALLVIYCLLAIPFRSYMQPLLVMSAIPFGAVGAMMGHYIMGFELSIMSMMGVVALSGVVVNDSLILLMATNQIRKAGASAQEAAVRGGARRFRAIVLTSLTTAVGLAPMIMETSVQARFLVPMAVSLGFGILWATLIILFCVPAFYLILEDLTSIVRWIYPKNDDTSPESSGSVPPAPTP